MKLEELKNEICKQAMPKHVAIILDGNGRWAKKRMLPRNLGHREGAKNLTKIVKEAMELKIETLTVFAFSTENWNRPVEEVEYLMQEFIENFNKYKDKFTEKRIRVKFIGEKYPLKNDILDIMNEIENKTKDNSVFNLVIALNYGSKQEIANAARLVCKEVIDGKYSVYDINNELIEKHLYSKDFVDVDLMIRTSGEVRISNFLLWQIAYAELYFTKTLWPDFDKRELYLAIKSYQHRNRRYGGLKEDEN